MHEHICVLIYQNVYSLYRSAMKSMLIWINKKCEFRTWVFMSYNYSCIPKVVYEIGNSELRMELFHFITEIVMIVLLGYNGCMFY